MPIFSAEIPQNSLPYQHDNFVYAEVMDKETTDLLLKSYWPIQLWRTDSRCT